MARTIPEIYNAIIDEKSNYTELDNLIPEADNFNNLKTDILSASKVALWRLIIYIISVSVWIHEGLWDLFKAEVDDVVASGIPGVPIWYQEQAYLFQYGDDLEYINGKFQYQTIDEEKQIIKRNAVKEVGNQVLMKVAKLDSGSPVPLSTDELNAFISYMFKIKFAGTNVGVISYLPDLLNIEYKIYYDPIISFATIQTNVEATINSFIADLSFDGVLNITQLTDAIQAVEGVVDPIFQSAEAKAYNAQDYEEFTENYSSIAGHMTINDLDITYEADV